MKEDEIKITVTETELKAILVALAYMRDNFKGGVKMYNTLVHDAKRILNKYKKEAE